MGAVNPPIAECVACKAPIFFALSSKGKRMPIDAAERPDGNVILDGEGPDPVTRQPIPRAVVLGKADTPLGDPPRYVSHFVTCPNAGQFKRGGRR